MKIAILALMMLVQAPATAPAPAKPVEKSAEVQKVTDLEMAGLQKIARDYQQVLQELSQANMDVTKNHPGLQLDPKNPLSGTLVPVPKSEPKK